MMPVGLADANFVFSTDHAHAHFATDLAFFDFEGLAIDGMQFSTYGGDDNPQSLSGIFAPHTMARGSSSPTLTSHAAGLHSDESIP